MKSDQNIKRMKQEGQVIITSQTFRKSVVFDEGKLFYKGKVYQGHDWLLTYGHKQYERLIP